MATLADFEQQMAHIFVLKDAITKFHKLASTAEKVLGISDKLMAEGDVSDRYLNLLHDVESSLSKINELASKDPEGSKPYHLPTLKRSCENLIDLVNVLEQNVLVFKNAIKQTKRARRDAKKRQEKQAAVHPGTGKGKRKSKKRKAAVLPPALMESKRTKRE